MSIFRKYLTGIFFHGSICSSRCVLLSVLALSALVSAAQASLELTDTASINAMLNISQKNRYTKSEESIKQLQATLLASKKLGYHEGEILAAIHLGDIYFASNIDKALENANLANAIYKNAGLDDSKLEGRILMNLAEYYDEKGKIDSSAYYFYKLNDKIGKGDVTDIDLLTNTYVKLTVFWIKMDYDSLFLRDAVGSYIEKAQYAARQLPDSGEQLKKIYFLQAVYHHALKQYELARKYYKDYLANNADLSLYRSMSTYLNIGETYLNEEQPNKALIYINKVADVSKDSSLYNSLRFFLSVANFMKGRALYQLGQYQNAINLINISLKRIPNSGNALQGESIEAHKILAGCYDALGNYKAASDERKMYIQLHDSLLQKEKLNIVNSLEMRFRVSEKDRELASQKLTTLEAENELRTKDFWLVVTGFIIVILIMAFAFWQRNSRHKQKLQRQQIHSMQQSMEIKMLNAAMRGEEKERTRIAKELHDGVGGLLSAAFLNLEHLRRTSPHPEDVLFSGNLIKEAAAELRKTAHNLIPERLLQDGLVEAVRYYCETLGRNSDTKISFQVQGEQRKLNSTLELSIYRIIQELLHNILKHARAKTALVELSYYENNLSISIEDDGVGMEMATHDKSDGLGLNSISERVKIMRGSLDMQSSPESGTSIFIELEHAVPLA